MTQRYAVDFQIESAGSRGVDLLDQAANTASDWLRELTNLPPLNQPSGIWATDNGRVIVHRERSGSTAVYRFEWSLQRDESKWTTELQLSTSGDEVDLHAVVHSDDDGSDHGVRLSLIAILVEEFDCRRPGAKLQAIAGQIGQGEIDLFIDGILQQHERPPLAAVSLADGLPLLDPNQLQQHLAGLTNVYLLDDAASARLSERVGARRSCYAGAVRLYAPNFTDRDLSTEHPFWLANQIRKQRRTIWRAIAAQAAHLADRSASPAEFYLRQDKIRQDQLEQLQQAAPSAAQGHEVRSLQKLVERERQWRSDAISERDRFQNLYEQAQRELDALRSEVERETSEQSREADSIRDAVQIAEDRSSKQLSFLNSAFTSAEASRFPQINNVLKELDRLNMLAQLLYRGELLPEQIVQWLNDEGSDCSTESEDTMHRYGEERVFRDETGQLVSMPMHIKLGGGSGQNNRLRIHFAWMPEYQEILVGHVGRHLKTSRS